MNSGQVREGELKAEFDALEAAFNATGIDFYVIGALARDIWFARGNKKFTATRDVDFAVLVATREDYQRLKDYLKTQYQFTESSGNEFVLISRDKRQIDLLPFSEATFHDTVKISGEAFIFADMPGLPEIYRAGTGDVRMETGHHFKIATLPAIVLLKLIAYDDRPEVRLKDPLDIAIIIEYYFDLMADQIYAGHAEEFTDGNNPRTLQQISARIIGKEIKSICKANQPLQERCKQILNDHIVAGKNSLLIREMTRGTHRPLADNIDLLEQMLSGL